MTSGDGGRERWPLCVGQKLTRGSRLAVTCLRSPGFHTLFLASLLKGFYLLSLSKNFLCNRIKNLPNPEVCDPDLDPFQWDCYYYCLNHDLEFTKRFYNHFLIPPCMASLALNWNSSRFYFKLAHALRRFKIFMQMNLLKNPKPLDNISSYI